MPASDYYAGVAFFVITYGGIAAATWLIVRARLPRLVGATRALALAVVATAALLAAHVLPAALGVLSREAAAALAVLLALAAWRLPRAEGAPVPLPEPAAEEHRLARLLARYATWAFGIWIVLVGLAQLYAEPIGFDAASAYLPIAARWIQDGSLWVLGDWIPSFFYGASPGNGSMLFAASALPWDNDFLAHYAIYPFVPLTALALYVVAREVRAPHALATLLGLMVAAVPVLVEPALRSALLDPVLYFGFAAGLAFLLRHRRTGDAGDLVLAGVALGIAFGTKLYGFTAVPILLAVWAGARLLARDGWRAVLRQALVVVGLIALFGGIWVVRNAVETGNPAFPVAVEVAGVTIFDAPPDPLRPLIGGRLVDYFDDPGEWVGELRRQFRVATGVPVIVLGLAVVAVILLLVRRRLWGADDDSDGLAAAAVVAVLALSVSYVLTPYSAAGPPGEPIATAANVRYGVPGMIVAVAAAAWLAPRLGPRLRLGFTVLAFLAYFDALRVGFTVPRSTTYGAFVLAALALAIGRAARRLRARRDGTGGRALPRPGPVGWAALAALAAVGLAVLGETIQRTYNETRYVGRDPALDWVIANTEDGARVGVTGAWTDQGVAPIYPAFGTRLQNDVDYVGPKIDGLLRTYEDREPFVEALEREGFEVLVVGRARPFSEDPERTGSLRPLEAPREERWARSAGFERVAESDRFVVLQAS
ncbi:MAG TPA: phospholipid carrier-dependent glycosyltransferase [Solirubrobacterales bacterium]